MRIIEGQTQDNGLFARTKGFLIGNPGISTLNGIWSTIYVKICHLRYFHNVLLPCGHCIPTPFSLKQNKKDSDWYFNINEYAFQTFLWSHALLPQKAYLASVKACGWDSFLTNCSRDFTHPSVECRVANTHAYHYVPKTW